MNAIRFSQLPSNWARDGELAPLAHAENHWVVNHTDGRGLGGLGGLGGGGDGGVLARRVSRGFRVYLAFVTYVGLTTTHMTTRKWKALT